MSRNSVTIYNHKLNVVDFEALLGLDALWTYAVQTKNEKARLLMTELLVDAHLQFNEELVTPEARKHIPGNFI